MTKCFGIVSWLPDKEPARQQRKDRVIRLLKQLDELWPNNTILMITQNWKDFMPKSNNKIIRVDFKNGLGILKARKTLRKEFLKLNYDYLIMFDDDAIISGTKEAAKEYMDEIDKHKDGFCFIHHKGWQQAKNKTDTYAAAQLNLCAISKSILEKEDIPAVDPNEGQGFEDHVYSVLLHVKYAKQEFYPPETIRCIQFKNSKEVAPSTWASDCRRNFGSMSRNTDKIIEFIIKYKDLPNLEIFWKYALLVLKNTKESSLDTGVKIPRRKPDNNKRADGRAGAYLYF